MHRSVCKQHQEGQQGCKACKRAETSCPHCMAVILVNEDTAEVAVEVMVTLDKLVGLPATLDTLTLEEILETVGTPKVAGASEEVADAAEEWLEGEQEVIEVLSGVDNSGGEARSWARGQSLVSGWFIVVLSANDNSDSGTCNQCHLHRMMCIVLEGNWACKLCCQQSKLCVVDRAPLNRRWRE
jgi:ferredoxin